MALSFLRKCKIEYRALSDLALGPNPASVTVNDTLYDCQAHTHPVIFARIMEALKDAEELVIILHVETDSVILHIEESLIFLSTAADFNDAVSARSRKLDGIGEQIENDLLDKDPVAIGTRRRLESAVSR